MNLPPQKHQNLPPMHIIPGTEFFSLIKQKDVYIRLNSELLPAISSIGGNILKVDGTKRCLSKLNNLARKSAGWVHNVGNEFGQLLQSVVTQGEDSQYLRKMWVKIIKRYHRNGWKPPLLLYCDRDCCRQDGGNLYLDLFDPTGEEFNDIALSTEEIEGWRKVIVILDLSHVIARTGE